MEYGVLVYDIPSTQMPLYQALYNKIRWAGIRVNNSVFLVQWGQKAEIERLVASAEAQAIKTWERKKVEGKGKEIEKPDIKKANVHILKFDISSKEEIDDMANQATSDYIEQVSRSFQRRLEKMKTRNEPELPLHVQKHFVTSLEIAEGLITAFQLTEDVEYRFQAVKEIIAAQLNIEAVMKKRRKKTSGLN